MKKFFLAFVISLSLLPNACKSDLFISSHDDTKSYTRLMAAATACDLTSVKTEINRNPSEVNARDSDMGNATPLDDAVSRECLQVAEFLLAHGANVNLAKSDGLTALHIAARRGNIEVIKLLLAHKARINAVARNGETPLDLALRRNHPEAAEFLKQHGGIEGKPKT